MRVYEGLPMNQIKRDLVEQGQQVDVGEWHARRVNNPLLVSIELQNVSVVVSVPWSVERWQQMSTPNLPWAEDHFQERVSGHPWNPPPSHVDWPWAQHNEKHQTGEQFSHSYPERLWPKAVHPGRGIRFAPGDLEDVVQMLMRSPLTRQAFIPLWFPEDTGAVHGERVPCTIGYHVLIRQSRVHIVYYIRSCDLLRYFSDDVYMAGRLMQWITRRLNAAGRVVFTGELTMHVSSLHVFEGDRAKLRSELRNG